MKHDSTTSGFVSGTASVYQTFWEAWCRELALYPPLEKEGLYDYLTEQVIGSYSPGDEDCEEDERQRAFTEAMQEISARALVVGQGEEGDDQDKEEDDQGEGKSK